MAKNRQTKRASAGRGDPDQESSGEAIHSRKEIAGRLEIESRWRSRLAVPAITGGVLYLLSGIITSSALNGAPTVGLVQAITPALRGQPNPTVSPRTGEVEFISHHAFALIAGSTIAAIAIGVLTFMLLLLVGAARFRNPRMWSYARAVVIVGGVAVAAVSIGHEVVGAVNTHAFAVGHDHSNRAVEQALTKGTANILTEYLDLFAGLLLAVGMVVTMINTMRTGLLNRWMGILGIFSAILIFLPIGGATLELIPAFWMVAMGILLMGHWPNGDPPAWKAGEARPWPTQAEMRAEHQQATGQPPDQPRGGGSLFKRGRGSGRRAAGESEEQSLDADVAVGYPPARSLSDGDSQDQDGRPSNGSGVLRPEDLANGSGNGHHEESTPRQAIEDLPPEPQTPSAARAGRRRRKRGSSSGPSSTG